MWAASVVGGGGGEVLGYLFLGYSLLLLQEEKDEKFNHR